MRFLFNTSSIFVKTSELVVPGKFNTSTPFDLDKPRLLILFNIESSITTTLFYRSSMPFSSCRKSLFLSLLMSFLLIILWLHLLFDISWEFATNCLVKKSMIVFFSDTCFSNSKNLFLRISTCKNDQNFCFWFFVKMKWLY